MMKKKHPNTKGKVKERSLPAVHAIPAPASRSVRLQVEIYKKKRKEISY